MYVSLSLLSQTFILSLSNASVFLCNILGTCYAILLISHLTTSWQSSGCVVYNGLLLPQMPSYSLCSQFSYLYCVFLCEFYSTFAASHSRLYLRLKERAVGLGSLLVKKKWFSHAWNSVNIQHVMK